MAVPRTLKLAAIGTGAGLFSGLFGVGGGAVIVPLLVLWLAYADRVAAGTSLAAIVIIAIVGTASNGAYGNVNPGVAAWVGLPAVVGVVGGTALQQRVPTRWLSLGFAVLLVVAAVKLLVG